MQFLEFATDLPAFRGRNGFDVPWRRVFPRWMELVDDFELDLVYAVFAQALVHFLQHRGSRSAELVVANAVSRVGRAKNKWLLGR